MVCTREHEHDGMSLVYRTDNASDDPRGDVQPCAGAIHNDRCVGLSSAVLGILQRDCYLHASSAL
eukprot:3402542-Rhodomonas_salina.2